VGKLRRREASAADPAKRKKVTLLPGLAPAWAREKYAVGSKPVKVDALEYLPQVRCVWREGWWLCLTLWRRGG
jgi:hypothetical protein